MCSLFFVEWRKCYPSWCDVYGCRQTKVREICEVLDGKKICKMNVNEEGEDDTNETIIGIRRSWRNTNWRFRYDGVSQWDNVVLSDLNTIFKIMIRDEQHQLLHDGYNIFQLGIVCFLSQNCHVCFNGSTTVTTFNNIVMLPAIEDYLSINVNFEPHRPVDLTGIL